MSDVDVYPILLRNSERSDFRRCPQRWQWRWRDHLVPIEFNTGPLVFGTFGHLALAEYYIPGTKRGPHPAETWDAITKDYIDSVRNVNPMGTNFVDDDVEITWDDARSLGHDILVNYIDHWGNDDHWEIIWTEKAGRQIIPHPYNKSKPFINYCFTFDCVVRDHAANGRVRLVDHKFMKAIQKRHLYLDSQNGGYIAIGTHLLRKEGLIGEKEAIRDLVYNFVRKQRYPEGKHRNRFGEWLNKGGDIMKRQPLPFFDRCVIERTAKERNQQIQHIQAEALHMKAFRDEKLPIHKNPTRDCTWDCNFFTLCGIHEAGGDVDQTIKMLYKKEDPYTEYYDDAISPKRLRED